MSRDEARAEARRIARAAAAESCAALLGEISALLRRFVVMSAAQARVVALWTVHTHMMEAAEATPSGRDERREAVGEDPTARGA
jgi:hypothetical protein